MTAACLFWVALALVGYAYAGYPLLATALARRFGTAPLTDAAQPPLTVVIAAWNEEARIGARVRDVLAQDYPADRLAVLVVSDGCAASVAGAVPNRRASAVASSG